MALALEQARLAVQKYEVPVGAVVVKDGRVIGEGHNACVANSDPTGHAEINAIRQASQNLANYRLDGCTLYVTLEPCAMCAGAILNARLQRVVFGAYEPKTGAGGSIVNLFDYPTLNHHTHAEGGVLAQQASELLQNFFERRRGEARTGVAKLREDALRTPEKCFQSLDAYPWTPRYVQDLPSLAGLRMHYLDEGPKHANLVFLCLHAPTHWSYFFKDVIPTWLQAESRVLAPDLIGFGKSDKPKRKEQHSLEFHARYLCEWIETLDLRRIVLVVEQEAEMLGRMLPIQSASRYLGFLLLETSNDTPRVDRDAMAYAAPFPDAGHRAGVTFFKQLNQARMPESPSVRQFWEKEWQGTATHIQTSKMANTNTSHAIPPAVAFAALDMFAQR